MNDLTAGEVMTRIVYSVDADWPLDRVRDTLVNHGISGAPVLDKGKLVGVISATDLMIAGSRDGASGGELSYYREVEEADYWSRRSQGFMHIDKASTTKARDAMTPAVFSVDENAGIDEVAQIMVNGIIHRVLVTSGKNVVGIISALDLVKLLRGKHGGAKRTKKEAGTAKRGNR